ncbi:lactosylceramide 1,3-N-acetyl-beta-D-glucosaminyltransferase-like [Watersipora subatra]|uniref:lactosylceramide 1,3-N-acetyl-beta-D-glucosaminyltransferase-like n=1 Tax=Watersipora subatra TaxID=2589382 RepID=UPI00355B6828
MKVMYCSRRTVMRASWLNRNFLSSKLGLKTKIVFFVGKADTEESQLRMEYESEHYRDIVQSDFTDDYRHNTYKAMSYLRWTSINCPTTKLLMKIDDDALLKSTRIDDLKSKIAYLLSYDLPIYAGKDIDRVPFIKESKKWYRYSKRWAKDEFPMCFQGLVYFLTPQHTGELFETALHTPYMYTDDVFLGILVDKTESDQFYVENLYDLFEYAFKGFSLRRTLKPKWDHGFLNFIQMPDIRLYYHWSLKDLKLANLPQMNWFQW